MLETMFPKFFWSILIPFFAFLFGGGPRRALLESSEASADLGEGDWKIQTRSGEFMHPHGLKSCLLAPLLFLLSAIFISVGAHLLCAFGFKRGVIWVGCVLEVQIRSSSCIPRTQNTPAHAH